MKLSFPRNTVIAIIVIAVLLLAGAYYLFGTEKPTLGVLENTAAASDAELRFLTLASSIEPLVLDTTLLRNPQFERLTDIRVNINAEASGRTNPFEPLSQ